MPDLSPGTLAALALTLGLSACSTLPQTPLPEREQLRDFAIDARFALRHTPPDAAPQSAGGRLDWRYQGGASHVLIANPLGIGLAELETRPGQARLTTSDHREYSGEDAEQLLFEATGQDLPVQRLPAWLLGRADRHGQLTLDASGRPLHLSEAGWEIDYEYADASPGALPQRLHLRRPPDLDLRLRIEEWKSAP